MFQNTLFYDNYVLFRKYPIVIFCCVEIWTTINNQCNVSDPCLTPIKCKKKIMLTNENTCFLHQYAKLWHKSIYVTVIVVLEKYFYQIIKGQWLLIKWTTTFLKKGNELCWGGSKFLQFNFDYIHIN